MKRIPSQFYILAIVCLLPLWPRSWCLSLIEPYADDLLTALLLQSALVIACNILISEPWKYAVILIEAFCMLFNVTLFLMPMAISVFHGQIMLAAFIIELLIITISIQGAAIGISIPMAGSRLRDLRRFAFYRDSCARTSRC